MSLFAGRAAGVDPAALWSRLGLPAVIELDSQTGAIVQVIEEVSIDGNPMG
jgi:hypothetical protein